MLVNYPPKIVQNRRLVVIEFSKLPIASFEYHISLKYAIFSQKQPFFVQKLLFHVHETAKIATWWFWHLPKFIKFPISGYQKHILLRNVKICDFWSKNCQNRP